MIISLRGTNGAGKSTLVRSIMKRYPNKTLLWEIPDRRRCSGQVMSGLGEEHDVFIPGHYEIANGGVDTIKSIDQAYLMILRHAKLGHVLYEGKNMSDGWRRASEFLPREHALIVTIDLPWEKCVKAVRERGHKIKEETIERLSRKCRKDHEKLVELGFNCHLTGRIGAEEIVLEALGL